MRYIDTSGINVPPNWLTLAKAQYGNTYSSLWSYFKVDIESLVGKKCWFSESENSGADNDVEHFRPKGQAVKALTKKHADLDNALWLQLNSNSRVGYAFLEFEFINYRYACTFVNSLRTGSNKKVRGKTNFFPLQLNSPFANSTATIVGEVNALLDPCAPNDPEMLTFTDIGTVEPHVSLVNNSWEYCRVMSSIEVYHLHYFRFVEWRKTIWDDCKAHIEIADELQASVLQTELEIRSLKYHLTQLNRKIAKTSEYSAVAIDCIRLYKQKMAWLQMFFPDAKIAK